MRATTCCNEDSSCPESAPCCSQYGECGVGAYCLGGCDPRFSFQRESCVPGPTCLDKSYTFDSLDRVVPIDKFQGDPNVADWTVDGTPLIYNGSLLLTMAKDTVGTVIASTRYVLYGKVSARLKTSRGRGVVTAFITMSNVKDEVDFEWIGASINTAQTNYYHKGFLDYHNSVHVQKLSNTFENYHTYEVDWRPDEITWSIDGVVCRTKKRSETWNNKTEEYDYPQTPARVELSVWPGGLASNGKGTISWAGGTIDWDSPYMQPHGYYYATIDTINISCYPSTLANFSRSGSTAYTYHDAGYLNTSVGIIYGNFTLASLLATGTNLSIAETTQIQDETDSGETKSTIPAQVPGLNNAIPQGYGHAERENSTESAGDIIFSDATTGASSSPSVTGFQQGGSALRTGSAKSGASRTPHSATNLLSSYFQFCSLLIVRMCLEFVWWY